MKTPSEIINSSINKTENFIDRAYQQISNLEIENENHTRSKLEIEGAIMRNRAKIEDLKTQIDEWKDLLKTLKDDLQEI